MFADRTTFVIGAGASCELGLKSGDGLMEAVAFVLARTNENMYGFADEGFVRQVQGMIHKHPGSPNDTIANLKRAQSVILRALPWSLSIDNLLHNHQDDEWVISLGKAAIAHIVLKDEASSHFFPHVGATERIAHAMGKRVPVSSSPSTDREELRASWYQPFARTLFSEVRWADLPTALSALNFVVFNYDRCFEQFLLLAIQEHYDVDPDAAAEALKSTTILHPYGVLGPLGWQPQDGIASLPLGEDLRVTNVFEVGQRLKTFTESVDSRTVDHVKTAVGETDTVIFLGFGFLKQNVRLLQPGLTSAKRAYATAFELPPPNVQEVERIVVDILGLSDAPGIERGKCVDLFQNFRMQLSG